MEHFVEPKVQICQMACQLIGVERDKTLQLTSDDICQLFGI